MMTCSPVHLNFNKPSDYGRGQMDIKAESDWPAAAGYLGYATQVGGVAGSEYAGLYSPYPHGVVQGAGMVTLGIDAHIQQHFDHAAYQAPAYADGYHGYQAMTHPARGEATLFAASPYQPQAPAHFKQEFQLPGSRRIEHELSLFRVEKRICDVCGDTAAGFHCGAYVCEACKKFFIRSSRAELQGNSKYSCTKNGNCDITKETRTHCQFCRFKKCLTLNMFPPGKNPAVGAPISEIPCRVCGAPSSGFHFGAITCEGCKGFFRRTIKERDSGKYICSKGSRCEINQQSRNACKSCRFTKCIQAGMSSEGSRIGRQPNAVKHMCAQEIQEIKTKRIRADPFVEATFAGVEHHHGYSYASAVSPIGQPAANHIQPMQQAPGLPAANQHAPGLPPANQQAAALLLLLLLRQRRTGGRQRRQ